MTQCFGSSAVVATIRFVFLAVELGGDDVQAPQHGHHVGEHQVLDDHGKTEKWMNDGGRVRTRQAVWLPSATR